jgi:hypothetical protein
VFRDSTENFSDGKPGVPRIAAGASAAWGTLERLPPAVKEHLAEARFRLIGKGDLSGNTAERIWRLVYPEDVLAGASLKDQGEVLARWLTAGFEEVEAILAAAPAANS